ncbi:hypothetical protein AB0L05_27605 [Nonomuraea pusilla]
MGSRAGGRQDHGLLGGHRTQPDHQAVARLRELVGETVTLEGLQ